MGAQLVILAAGVGRRFGGLKQLSPVGPSGEAIMDFTVLDAVRNGFDEVVLVIRPEIEADMRSHVDRSFGRSVPVRFVYQELDVIPGEVPLGRTRPWGTVQAVLAAAPAIRGPFGVANADDSYGTPALAALREALARPATTPPTWAMIAFEVGDTLPAAGAVSRGLVHAESGLLRSIEEVHSLRREPAGIVRDTEDGPRTVPADTLVSMNLWGFGPEVLQHLSRRFARFLADGPDTVAECYLSEEIGVAVADGSARVMVVPTSSRWCGMTSASDIEAVRSTLASQVADGTYPAQLWP
jgi:NDP-sugar pyrophosphorylase family protein